MVLCGGDCSEGIICVNEGMSFVLISATSPCAMSRLVASPDAETPSYWLPPPCRMRFTISSEVLPYFTVTLQPVCVWNGVTQSAVGLFWPFSTYPGHAIRFSAPSPAPTFVGSVEPDVVGLLFPQAAPTSANAQSTA